MLTIIVTVYKNGNKTKCMHVTAPDGSHAVNNEEIFNIIREYPNEDFKFIDKNNGNKDITVSCLLNILKFMEKKKSVNINLTNVIKHGGFVNYIKELEMKTEHEEQPPQLRDLDLTKQTITLGDDDNPSVSLMRGHVDELTYVKAFRNEGWDNNGIELTEEQWAELAKAEKGELVHTYGVLNLEKNQVQWNLSKDAEGAEPMTVRHW